MTKGNHDTPPVYCKLLPVEGSDYCPKHILLMQEEPLENARRMERARKGKEKKKLFRDMLESSPLRGYNPAFDEKKRSGYEQ